MMIQRLLTVAASLVLSLALYFSAWGQRFEMSVLDRWFALRGRQQVPQDVVVIAIDEASYRELGIPLNQALPRSVHARLIQRLAHVGARRVVFDILFMDPSAAPDGDAALAQALTTLPTVLGAEQTLQDTSKGSIRSLKIPHKPFLTENTTVGLVGFRLKNGVAREFSIREGRSYAPLAEVALGNELKNAPEETDFINFYGGPQTIPTYSYYQIIDPEFPLPEKFLKDKIVFVGLSMRTGLGADAKDQFLTPYAKDTGTFGVEIHASAAANLLQQNWIRRANNTREIVFLLFFSAIASLILLSVRPSRAAFFILFLVGAWCASAYGLFLNHYFLPGAVVSFIVLPLVYLASTLGAYFVAWRKQQRLFRAFEKYLSPEMARRVAESKNALQLGGKRVVATAMFTDIQGFTSISETLTPEKVGEMLNDYFSTVMGAIFDNKGTLIKFIGDAVFALWGAPLDDEQHAEHAFLTALAITQAVERFNATGKYPQLHTRVGIHTGDMHVGNFGSHERFDFTALGDSVNFASRLEGLNKYLGTTILLSETTAKLLRSTTLLPLGKFVVAGKSESINLYTILEPEKLPSALPQWLKFLELLQLSRIQEAKELLQSPDLRALIPSKTIERYRLTLSAPWSGAVILAEK